MPVLELNPNPVLATGDLLSAMHFPRDEKSRLEMNRSLRLAVIARQTKELESVGVATAGHPGYDPERILKEILAPLGGTVALAETPPYSDFYRLSTHSAERGCIAGLVLTFVLLLQQVLPPGSVKKATVVVKSLLKTNQHVNGRSQRFIQDSWSSFRSVSHLWAAHVFWVSHIKTGHALAVRNRERFLQFAKWFQDAGLCHRSQGQKSCLLDPEELWRLPQGLELEDGEIIFQDLPDFAIPALRDAGYQIP